MEILFDTLSLDMEVSTSNNNLNCAIILPNSPIVNVMTQIIVVFDAVLRTSTTLTLSDGSSSIFITVQAGKNYGLGYYTPTTSGAMNFTLSHIGQSDINFPDSLPNINVNNKDVTSNTIDPEVFLERPKGKKFDGSTNKIVSV